MTQPGQETDLFHPLAAVESKIDQTNALLQQLLNAKGVITPANLNPNAQVGNSFASVTVDLTAARTAVQIASYPHIISSGYRRGRMVPSTGFRCL